METLFWFFFFVLRDFYTVESNVMHFFFWCSYIKCSEPRETKMPYNSFIHPQWSYGAMYETVVDPVGVCYPNHPNPRRFFQPFVHKDPIAHSKHPNKEGSYVTLMSTCANHRQLNQLIQSPLGRRQTHDQTIRAVKEATACNTIPGAEHHPICRQHVQQYVVHQHVQQETL